MVLHYKAFREELYIEHLEEAAYLYETRLAWLSDAEIGWQDLADLDARIEAHLDALIVGGKLAFETCIESLEEAEASTVHVIVRVFCRYQSIEHLANLWLDFDYDDEEKVVAVSDALKWECPPAWLPHLVNVFASDKVEMFPVLVSSVVYSSREEGEKILAAIPRANPSALPHLFKALSFCDRKLKSLCVNTIARYVNNDDVALANEAAMTLSMMGESRTLPQCLPRIDTTPLLFALAGNVEDSRRLLKFAQDGIADEACLLALGLSGNLEAVPSLIGYLKHPDYGLQAAQALSLISGAPLYEEVHVAEKVEEDELFEHEIEPFKQGELPKNIDGQAFGAEVKQLSVEMEDWKSWFDKNRGQFTQGLRYRNGRPFGPAELLNNLISNQTPYDVRISAYQELVIRYALALPFAADDLVYKQQKQLNEIHAWVQQTQGQWQVGQWYFAGVLQA